MYLELAEFVSDVPSLLDFDNKEEINGIVGQIIYNASRLFDAETFAPEGYYSVIPQLNVFTEKSFRTNGTEFLNTHHFVELESVSYGTSNITSRCIYESEGQLIRIGYGTWYPVRSEIKINARWGWKAIPEDVRIAVAAQARLRLSMTRLARGGSEGGLAEFELPELKLTWENAVRRYRELNQFAR